MFKINPEPTFEAKINIPCAGGKSQELEIVFRHRGRDKLTEINDEVLKLANEPDIKKEVDIIFPLIESWKVDCEFNRKNFDLLLNNYPSALSLIYAKYMSELLVSREGN